MPTPATTPVRRRGASRARPRPVRSRSARAQHEVLAVIAESRRVRRPDRTTIAALACGRMRQDRFGRRARTAPAARGRDVCSPIAAPVDDAPARARLARSTLRSRSACGRRGRSLSRCSGGLGGLADAGRGARAARRLGAGAPRAWSDVCGHRACGYHGRRRAAHPPAPVGGAPGRGRGCRARAGSCSSRSCCPPFAFDALTYHLTIVATWVQRGDLDADAAEPLLRPLPGQRRAALQLAGPAARQRRARRPGPARLRAPGRARGRRHRPQRRARREPRPRPRRRCSWSRPSCSPRRRRTTRT